MRVLAGAWTAHVIWYFREGERCFTELQIDIGRSIAEDAHEPSSQAGTRGDHQTVDKTNIASHSLVLPYAWRK